MRRRFLTPKPCEPEHLKRKAPVSKGGRTNYLCNASFPGASELYNIMTRPKPHSWWKKQRPTQKIVRNLIGKVDPHQKHESQRTRERQMTMQKGGEKNRCTNPVRGKIQKTGVRKTSLSYGVGWFSLHFNIFDPKKNKKKQRGGVEYSKGGRKK